MQNENWLKKYLEAQQHNVKKKLKAARKKVDAVNKFSKVALIKNDTKFSEDEENKNSNLEVSTNEIKQEFQVNKNGVQLKMGNHGKNVKTANVGSSRACILC